MCAVIFTFPHKSMISLACHGEKEGAKIQLQKNLRSTFTSVSHTSTTTKIEATRNKMSLEGPSAGLGNPCVHSNPSIGKDSQLNCMVVIRFDL